MRSIMSHAFALPTLILLLFWSTIAVSTHEKRLVLFVAGRNVAQWCKKNLDSIFSQNYENYHVIYVDDASTDGTGARVKNYIIERGLEDKVTLIINEKHLYKVHNQYHAIHTYCDDNDIIVEIDADDWFAHDHVLAYINDLFQDKDLWLAYGNYDFYEPEIITEQSYTPKKIERKPRNRQEKYQRIRQRHNHKEQNSQNNEKPKKIYRKFSGRYPDKIIENGTFRTYDTWLCSGLRTYYAKLFKQIKKEDLIYYGKNEIFYGKFIPKSGDLFTIIPMLEMCQKNHFMYIEDVLYICNRERKIDGENNYSIEFKELGKELKIIIQKKPMYHKLQCKA